MKTDRKYWGYVDRIGDGILLVLFGLIPLLPFAPGPPERHERFVVSSFGIGLYLIVLLVGALLFAGARRPERLPYRMSFCRSWDWVRRWHGCVAIGLCGGALVGMLLAATIGGFWGDTSLGARCLKGAYNGGFYLLVWAPGGALVICLIQAFGPKKG